MNRKSSVSTVKGMIIWAVVIGNIIMIGYLTGAIPGKIPSLASLLLLFHIIAAEEIGIRRVFDKEHKHNWAYYFSWICRFTHGLTVTFSAFYLIDGGSFADLFLASTYLREEWFPRAIMPLFCMFSICGIVLLLVHRETRAKAGIHTAFTSFGVLCLIGIMVNTSGSEPLPLIPSAIVFGAVCFIPFLYGVAGALFFLLWGKKIYPVTESVKKTLPANDVTVMQPSLESDIEQELYRQKSAYELCIEEKANSEKQALNNCLSKEKLVKTAYRLFNEGQTAATLNGQRQLVYWMVGAVPELDNLTGQQICRQFFDPSLEDDPDVFLPVLFGLLAEAARLIECGEALNNYNKWRRIEPETLCAGWYALTRFSQVIETGRIFSEEAERLEQYLIRNKSCRKWLDNSYKMI